MSKHSIKIVLFVIALMGLSNVGWCSESCDTTIQQCNIEKYDTNKITKVTISIDKTKTLKSNNTDFLKSNPKLTKAELDKRFQAMYKPAEFFPPSFIVVHYAVTTTMGQTINSFYDAGVSAHFTVDKDGTIYKHIDEENIAFHAGPSFWRGKYGINWYSIGIEQINTGWDVNNPKWKEKRSAPQQADGKNWETWPPEQIRSIAGLLQELAEKYDIKPWNIIGHSDCSCGRKVDPGPLFPWKKLYDEYGVGFWPEEDATITKEMASGLTLDDYMHLLQIIGYPIPGFASLIENTADLNKVGIAISGAEKMSDKLYDSATISAFQYHYMQDKFENDPSYKAGELDKDTQLTILKCLKSIVKTVDNTDYSRRMIEALSRNNVLSDEAKKVVENFTSIIREK